MAHDVFISYSSKDKRVGDATCAMLESRGIRCWLAPRDIMPGSEWGASIVEAIGKSRVMVLIYTSSSNASPQVRREVERAVARGLHVIPFRVEDVPMSPALEYFISAPHWLDALSPPLEAHLDHLGRIIQAVLEAQKSAPGAVDPGEVAAAAGASSPAPASSLPSSRAHGPPSGALSPRREDSVPRAALAPSASSNKTKLVLGAGAFALVIAATVAIVIAVKSGGENNEVGNSSTSANATNNARTRNTAESTPAPPPAREPAPTAANNVRSFVAEPKRPPAPDPVTPPAPREPGPSDVKRFWEAMSEGAQQLPQIQRLLEDFPQLANQPDDKGDLPLYVAARRGDADVAAALLDRGAAANGVSALKNTALHGAAAGGITDSELIRKLAPGNVTARNLDGSGDQPLHVAVRAGNVETARLLLGAGADVNSVDKDAFAPVQAALRLKDAAQAHAMAAALAEAGARGDFAARGQSAGLHLAAERGDAPLLSAMIAKGAKVAVAGPRDRTPLQTAVVAKQVEAVKVLTGAKSPALDSVDADGATALHHAAALTDTQIANVLLKAGAKLTTWTKQQQTPLHTAARGGNVEMIKLFMTTPAAGAILAEGKSPTVVAVAEAAGKTQAVALLRGYEVPMKLWSAVRDVNKPVPPDVLERLRKDPALTEKQDSAGRTLMHQVAAAGNTTFAKELLKINPALAKSLTPGEETPLHIAAQQKQAGMVKVLLEKNASVLATTKGVETPLHYAARAGAPAAEVIKLLLDAGADPAAQNRNRETPAEVAPDASTKSLLAASEQQAAPQREAWRSLELSGHLFDITAAGVADMSIRFRERGVFSAEGRVGGEFKRIEGTYYRGALTLTMNSPESVIFPGVTGTTYNGRAIPDDDGKSFTLKIGATSIKFNGR